MIKWENVKNDGMPKKDGLYLVFSSYYCIASYDLKSKCFTYIRGNQFIKVKHVIYWSKISNPFKEENTDAKGV